MIAMLAQDPIHWFDPRTWPWFLYFIAASMLFSWMKPLWKWFQRKRAFNWPSIQGHIEATSIGSKKWSGDEDPHYVANLTYSYSAGGKSYLGLHGEEFHSEEEAGEFLRDLQGKPVMVAYSPQKPSNSLIMPMALDALLEMRTPIISANKNREMSSIVRLVLWLLAALAAFGLAASLCINLAEISGRDMVGQSWFLVLTAGIFVVWIPANLAESRYRKSSRGTNNLKGRWKNAPRWARYVSSGLSVYVMVNVFIAVARTPGEETSIGQVGLVFSAAWMNFYYIALFTLYSAATDIQRQTTPLHT
jgi:hypothetical protein